MITGGCGGLGLLFARHLANTRSVNLILTGRSALTEETTARIQQLEALGSRVHYLQADVADSDAMEQGIRVAKERFGAIDAVITGSRLDPNQSDIRVQATESINQSLSGSLIR